VLVIAPVSVLPNWIKELNQFLKPHVPSVLISLLNSDLAKKKREQVPNSTHHDMATTMMMILIIMMMMMIIMIIMMMMALHACL
jgi:SNF2 family DNA or RNA helicase